MSYNRTAYRRRRSNMPVVWLIGIAVALIALGSWLYSNYISQSSQVVTVCRTEKVPSGGNGVTGNIVYTSNGVYTVNDYTLLGVGHRWNSLDTYGKIQTGKVYKVTSYGWRNGFLSMTPNAISVEPSSDEPIGSCS